MLTSIIEIFKESFIFLSEVKIKMSRDYTMIITCFYANYNSVQHLDLEEGKHHQKRQTSRSLNGLKNRTCRVLLAGDHLFYKHIGAL